MTRQDESKSDNEEVRNELVQQESTTVEEVRMLRQQMNEMYQAWMNGQAPPSSIPGYPNTSMPSLIQVQRSDPLYPSGFSPYVNTSNSAGTFTVPPLNTSMTTNPLFMPTDQSNIVSLPTVIKKSDNDQSNILHDGFPMEVEKTTKNEEHEEMARKMKSLEQNVRDLQGLGGHKGISFSDLCMFPYIHLPAGFKTPKFEKYDGHGDPIAHLKRYCNQLKGAEGKEEFFMAYFGESLVGIASEWFIDQDITNWHTWDDLARCFVQQFQYNIDIVPDRTSLANMRKKTTETFREYAIRWREQASRVKPPMKDSEMIDVFLEAQEPDCFHYLLSVIGKTFAEVIKIGEIVENGIKSGKIVHHAALKATTHVIKNGSENLGEKKMKEDVATVVPGTQKSPKGPPYQYALSQFHHYHPMQDPQNNVVSPNYAVYSAQSYVNPLNNPQWRAPTYQNSRHSPQNFRAPFNPRPRQEFDGNRRQKNIFTPLGESYTNLFHKLMQHNMIMPIALNRVNPNSRTFIPTARCEYHSNVQGHSTEDCWTLKEAIEDMIQEKQIMVEGGDDPNVVYNPLPTHDIVDAKLNG